jgi:hypothetical protein
LDEDDDPLVPLEPQPLRAMAAAAQAAAAAVSLYRTVLVLLATAVGQLVPEKLIGNFPII